MEHRTQDHSFPHYTTPLTVQEQEHIVQHIRLTLHAVQGLSVLVHTLEDEPAQAFLDLLQHLVQTDTDTLALARSYGRVFRKLAEAVQSEFMPRVPDAWQAYLLSRLIEDSNVWSQQVEQHGIQWQSPTLRMQANNDLRTLHLLFQLDAHMLWQLTLTLITHTMPELAQAWLPWQNLAPLDEPSNLSVRNQLVTIATSGSDTDWTALQAGLERYWAQHGTGTLARYSALRWQSNEQRLVGVSHPDPIQLSQLFGYKKNQALLRTNVERFLANLPAHDILLYGPPGTGKSSTVKALANTYAEQGLCLVEVPKEDCAHLHHIVALLRDHAPHYLLFIDDLSFEEHETQYKMLKVLLEGTIAARPKNILICATTNRMNLIKENFSERGKPTEDVNWRDSMDEKQSLAHRFGLRITFISPDQQQYLHIVRAMVNQRGIILPENTLDERALSWERQHAGRSGRIARQFVDDLEAELKFQTSPSTTLSS
jgi:predicted AAA+ superfamily ATPase